MPIVSCLASVFRLPTLSLALFLPIFGNPGYQLDMNLVGYKDVSATHKITRAIVVAMLLGAGLGAAIGLTTGPATGHAPALLGAFGVMYIQLIKVIAVPLVFVSIIDAVISTSLSWRTAGRWGIIVAINTTCALVIGLTISNLFRPGEGFVLTTIAAATKAPTTIQEFSFRAFLDTVIPSSILSPFTENNVISAVFLALLLGLAARSYCHVSGALLTLDSARKITQVAAGIINQAILWLVTLVPLAIFSVTAKTVAESGFAPFSGLARYVLVACIGLIIQIAVVYPFWIKRVGGVTWKRFWSAAARPVAYAFGTNSSLATVPITLNALDDLGVSKSASRLATCIGTNFNNDGIILYEAMAVLFVAQAYGIDLSLGEQIFAAMIALTAAIGVAGVPEAGIVSLSLVLGAVGLPLEILPLLLTVDWIVARMRSVVNVLSDMTVSIGVSGLE